MDTYAYDGAGRMTRATRERDSDPVSESVFAYNDLGDLESESQELWDSGSPKVVGSTYDQAGNRLTLAYPDAGVTLRTTYDILNRPDLRPRQARAVDIIPRAKDGEPACMTRCYICTCPVALNHSQLCSWWPTPEDPGATALTMGGSSVSSSSRLRMQWQVVGSVTWISFHSPTVTLWPRCCPITHG